MPSSLVLRVSGLGALTAAGQLVTIVSLPLYSRLVDPAPYGEYVVFVGAYTVCSVLAGLRYDSAMVIPRNNAVASLLCTLVLLLGLATSGLIASFTLLAPVLGRAFHFHASMELDFGLGLAIATAIGALQRCLIGWCIRQSRFVAMGWAQFAFSICTVLIQLWLVARVDQLSGLIWGFVVALGCQTACLAAFSSSAWSPRLGFDESFRGIRTVARKYRRFPLYMVGYALASSSRDRLVQIALGVGAGADVVGKFGLAYRVVFAPNSLIYSAVAPVFYSIASRNERRTVSRVAAALVEATFTALLVPYVAFAIEAPHLADSVLSEKWHSAGPYLSALAAPSLLLAATCWLDRAFDSFGRQRAAFTLEATFTVVATAFVLIFSQLIDAMLVVWIFAALALVYYWIYFLTAFKACAFEMADFLHAIVSAAVSVAITALLCLGAQWVTPAAGRISLYAATTAFVIFAWLRFRKGADILRFLVRLQSART